MRTAIFLKAGCEMATSESRPHPTNLWTAADVQKLPVSLRRYHEYCWTGPDVSGVGVTDVEVGVWAARIGEHQHSTLTALQMLDERGFVMFDVATNEVFVLRWFSFHKFTGTVGINSFNKGWRAIRSTAIRRAVKKAAEAAGLVVTEVGVSKENKGLPSNSNPNPNFIFREFEISFPLSVAALCFLLTNGWKRNSDSDKDRDVAAAGQVLNLIKSESIDDNSAAAQIGGAGWVREVMR